MKTHGPIPRDFEVRPLRVSQFEKAGSLATCEHCGLSWDDAVPTTWTPAPSARCPFEGFHLYPAEVSRADTLWGAFDRERRLLRALKATRRTLGDVAQRVTLTPREYRRLARVDRLIAEVEAFDKGNNL